MSFRLKSSMFERDDDTVQEPPKRIFYLSTEGTKTEQQYFEYVNRFRNELGIDSVVRVVPLKREGNATDPRHVFALLKECHAFLSSPGKKPDGDIFCVVIDKDNNSVDKMKQLISDCGEIGYDCFISNPCFEFWLLLHLRDVRQDYADKLDVILRNEKISDRNTFLSKEISDITHSRKSISKATFETHYLPSVDTAITRAKDFAQETPLLLDELGSNLPLLFEKLREKP